MFNIAQQRVQMVPGPGAAIPTVVWYEGSDLLSPGYALCANTDYGTATTADSARTVRAEKPASGNLANFIGVVADTGRTYQGPCEVPVYTPGSTCYGYTDLTATVVSSTLLTVQADSYYLGGVGEGLVVGVALQTVAAAGKVLMGVYGVHPDNNFDTLLSRSRTTVQLPTKAIWEKFDIATLRSNPQLGSLLVNDFTNQGDYPANKFNDTSSIQYLGTAAAGSWAMTTTDDNSACEIQWPVPILTTGGAPWALEVRLKCENVTTEKASWSVGLHEPILLAGDLQADAGATPTAANFLVFNTDAAATTALDTLYLLTGQSQNEHAAAIHTLVADTFFTVGLYYNGTTIQQYVNGVAAGTSISASDIAAVDFPAAKILVPSIGLKGAHGDAYTLTVDWIVAAQYAAA